MTGIDAILESVLANEGGYVNNPADKGGATNRGITAKTLGAWRSLGRPATPAEVQALSVEEAKAIYAAEYVERPGFAELADHPHLQVALVDAGVMSGPKRAIQMLQRALGLPDDGILGPVTLGAARLIPDASLALRFGCERLRFVGRLISKDLTDADRDGIPDNAEFASGWINRVAAQIEALA